MNTKSIFVKEVDQVEDSSKTSRILSGLSNLKFSQLIRRRKKQVNAQTDSLPDSSIINVGECEQITRPMSMYSCEVDLDRYMCDSTLLMALQETENKLLESENNRHNIQYKLATLQSQLDLVTEHNHQLESDNRRLKLQLHKTQQQLSMQSFSITQSDLNGRIREIELETDVASLNQQLAQYETEKEENIVLKLINSQGQIIKNSLHSSNNADSEIFDNEDGLFNNPSFHQGCNDYVKSTAESPDIKFATAKSNSIEDLLISTSSLHSY